MKRRERRREGGSEEGGEGRDEGEGERQLVLTGCSFILRALPFSNHIGF